MSFSFKRKALLLNTLKIVFSTNIHLSCKRSLSRTLQCWGGLYEYYIALYRNIYDRNLFFAEAKWRLLQNAMYVWLKNWPWGLPCKINGWDKLRPAFTSSVDFAITYKQDCNFLYFTYAIDSSNQFLYQKDFFDCSLNFTCHIK